MAASTRCTAGTSRTSRRPPSLACPCLQHRPDAYLRTKHVPLLIQAERAAIIDALRDVAYTHVSSVSTQAVLAELQPAFYVKGDDWRTRLPVEQTRLAQQCGIEVVFVPTVYHSSTAILQRFLDALAAPRT